MSTVDKEMLELLMGEGFGDYKQQFHYGGVIKKHSLLWGNDKLYTPITITEPNFEILKDSVRSMCDKCKIETDSVYRRGGIINSIGVILVPVECYKVIVPIMKKYIDGIETERKNIIAILDAKAKKEEEELNSLFKYQIESKC